jgi:hypothetical protein
VLAHTLSQGKLQIALLSSCFKSFIFGAKIFVQIQLRDFEALLAGVGSAQVDCVASRFLGRMLSFSQAFHLLVSKVRRPLLNSLPDSFFHERKLRVKEGFTLVLVACVYFAALIAFILIYVKESNKVTETSKLTFKRVPDEENCVGLQFTNTLLLLVSLSQMWIGGVSETVDVGSVYGRLDFSGPTPVCTHGIGNASTLMPQFIDCYSSLEGSFNLTACSIASTKYNFARNQGLSTLCPGLMVDLATGNRKCDLFPMEYYSSEVFYKNVYKECLHPCSTPLAPYAETLVFYYDYYQMLKGIKDRLDPFAEVGSDDSEKISSLLEKVCETATSSHGPYACTTTAKVETTFIEAFGLAYPNALAILTTSILLLSVMLPNLKFFAHGDEKLILNAQEQIRNSSSAPDNGSEMVDIQDIYAVKSDKKTVDSTENPMMMSP